MRRDSLDFGTMDISYLFRKMFVPTLLGMILSASINIADGIFVGHGVGRDALAAVNMSAPFFMLMTGVGLMFGTGASIVASIHLSQNKIKVADIHITQALTVSLLIVGCLTAFVYAAPARIARWLGARSVCCPWCWSIFAM